MQLVTDTKTLKSICNSLAKQPFIAIDTEFSREKYYYPKLCLIQIAWDGGQCAIDPLHPDVSLDPLFSVFNNKKVTKVFHSARQDIEIIISLSGKVPVPLFDTQVAAMVCGFGESVSYATLVEKFLKIDVDKSSRFTDWSKRPLSDRQLNYALSDVTHLRDFYPLLNKMLQDSNRDSWLDEEMADLTNSENYVTKPEEAWQRIKAKGNSRAFFGTVKELAKWREITAMNLNIPRQFVLRDMTLLEIAAQKPTNLSEIKTIREITKTAISMADEILAAIKLSDDIAQDDLPPLKNKARKSDSYNKPLIELLKVLLKMKCREHNVAEKLVASTEEIELLASEDSPEIKASKGWRYDVFGKYAMHLKNGEIALTVRSGQMEIVKL